MRRFAIDTPALESDEQPYGEPQDLAALTDDAAEVVLALEGLRDVALRHPEGLDEPSLRILKIQTDRYFERVGIDQGPIPALESLSEQTPQDVTRLAIENINSGIERINKAIELAKKKLG